MNDSDGLVLHLGYFQGFDIAKDNRNWKYEFFLFFFYNIFLNFFFFFIGKN